MLEIVGKTHYRPTGIKRAVAGIVGISRVILRTVVKSRPTQGKLRLIHNLVKIGFIGLRRDLFGYSVDLFEPESCE